MRPTLVFWTNIGYPKSGLKLSQLRTFPIIRSVNNTLYVLMFMIVTFYFSLSFSV